MIVCRVLVKKIFFSVTLFGIKNISKSPKMTALAFHRPKYQLLDTDFLKKGKQNNLKPG